MLTNRLKISDTTKTEFLFLNDQKIWKKYCRADLGSYSDPLLCWLSISVLTQGSRYIRNPAFCSLEFQKQIASEDHLLDQSIPNFMEISEMQKKIMKRFFDFEIIVFDMVALGTRFYRERILFVVCQYVNKQAEDFRSY